MTQQLLARIPRRQFIEASIEVANSSLIEQKHFSGRASVVITCMRTSHNVLLATTAPLYITGYGNNSCAHQFGNNII